MALATHWSWNIGFLVVCFCFLNGFGYPLILESWLSCFDWFSLWFWLSQWSSHLYRFVFLDGFTNSFCDQSCLKLHPIYFVISQLSSHLDAFGFHWFYQWFLLSHRLSIAELHAPHELQHVLKSLPREWCSRLHESMCFKISVLVQTRTQFPIVVIFVSCRWCSRLGESIISMFECGHIFLRMMLSPARGHMLFNTCVIVRDFLI